MWGGAFIEGRHSFENTYFKGALIRGGAHYKIFTSRGRSFEGGAHSRGRSFEGGRSFEEIRYCTCGGWHIQMILPVGAHY